MLAVADSLSQVHRGISGASGWGGGPVGKSGHGAWQRLQLPHHNRPATIHPLHRHRHTFLPADQWHSQHLAHGCHPRRRYVTNASHSPCLLGYLGLPIWLWCVILLVFYCESYHRVSAPHLRWCVMGTFLSRLYNCCLYLSEDGLIWWVEMLRKSPQSQTVLSTKLTITSMYTILSDSWNFGYEKRRLCAILQTK